MKEMKLKNIKFLDNDKQKACCRCHYSDWTCPNALLEIFSRNFKDGETFHCSLHDEDIKENLRTTICDKFTWWERDDDYGCYYCGTKIGKPSVRTYCPKCDKENIFVPSNTDKSIYQMDKVELESFIRNLIYDNFNTACVTNDSHGRTVVNMKVDGYRIELTAEITQPSHSGVVLSTSTFPHGFLFIKKGFFGKTLEFNISGYASPNNLCNLSHLVYWIIEQINKTQG